MNKISPIQFHTILHHYDEEGRDKEIESYVRQSVDYALAAGSARPNSVLDLGADYGYTMKYFQEQGVKRVKGIELYGNNNMFDLDISRESLEDPLLARKLNERFDLVYCGHVLEHLYNPFAFIQQVSQISNNVFLAVPDLCDDWAYIDGHLTLWNTRQLDHFMELNGFVGKAINRTLRANHAEVWGYYSKSVD